MQKKELIVGMTEGEYDELMFFCDRNNVTPKDVLMNWCQLQLPDDNEHHEQRLIQKYLLKYADERFFPALFVNYCSIQRNYPQQYPKLSMVGHVLLTAELEKDAAKMEAVYAQAHGHSKASAKVARFENLCKKQLDLVEKYRNTHFISTDQ